MNYYLCLDLGIDHGDVLHQVNNTGRVTVLVVVPSDELDESGVEHDTGLGIKDGRADVTLKVSGHKWFIRVSEEGLHVTLSTRLDVGANFLVSGLLGETSSQVNNGNINGGNTESHTGEFSLKFGDNLGDGLGGTSGGRNDIARGGTSSTPVLTRGRVDNSLGGGHGVHGGHKSLVNAEFVVDGLDHGGKTVGSAGSAGDEILRSVVFLLVDTHDDGLGVILGRGGVDDLLGTSINDGLGLLLGEENTSGLADVVSTEGTPADFLGVTASGGLDFLSIEDEEVSVNLNSLLGLSVDGVVLVLVGHVVRGGRTGVDTVQGNVLVLHHDTGDETSDTSETVDSHTGGHLQGRVVTDTLAEGGSSETVKERAEALVIDGKGQQMHMASFATIANASSSHSSSSFAPTQTNHLRGAGKGSGRADGGNESGGGELHLDTVVKGYETRTLNCDTILKDLWSMGDRVGVFVLVR